MIVVLGSTGMLGSMVAKTLKGDVIATTRQTFSVEKPDKLLLKEANWVINCIGLIKPYCGDEDKAREVNSEFPYTLPRNTIQIATDCVYSGKKGGYVESDEHDATDVYGITKSKGEAPHLKKLRCSIIGPEANHHVSLLDWFLSQTEANGYTNHYWNGVTTYHFAKICQAVIDNNIELPELLHIVPADIVTKAELLRIIAEEYGKEIPITDVNAPESIDRTLSTDNPHLNEKLWKLAGYDTPPTIRQMIRELSEL